ncbi:methylglyoxal synthase [Serpentinicella sp. ANB-PHB4]|uniref:methylglyoxal synthase n=1 Tax=Serpentinicella sp. ANB-PHB4 TaxID=3074076 RepID=UPI00285BBFC7|nr:methylglyoxal synthase [Serpentinicella sp. ANB-PHB4]MDR5659820.1 methylglyoxal synthase [Serpentinicella sp. ANB-PHB4]
MEKDFEFITMPKEKNIALIAHDNRKKDLINWAKNNINKLKDHRLCGTGTTAKRLIETTNLKVVAYKSGPLGGDQQIGARIVEGEINFIIFFWDPLASQPHDPDVKALLRIAVLYNIPIATNEATADFLLTSPLIEREYERKMIDYSKRVMKN